MAQNNVTKIPAANHATMEEMLNHLNFHASAIKDAVTFIVNHEEEPDIALIEAMRIWPNFMGPEFMVLDMMVSAILEDRVRRAEAGL